MTDATTEHGPDAAPAKPPKDTKNDVTRPKAGTATGRVWEIADEQSKVAGEPAKRKGVIDAFVAEGGNASTGATQYGRWRKYNGLGRDTKTSEEPAAA
jgi:hypothetical protein